VSDFLLVRTATVRRLLGVSKRVALPFRLVRVARGFFVVREVAEWMVTNRLAYTVQGAEQILRELETRI
jgi:hypothetical protein